jgi:hypothetical protein
MNSRCRRDFVADRYNCIEALLSGDIEVVGDLIRLKVVTPGLYFEECDPRLLTPGYPDQAVGSEVRAVQSEWHLDECFNTARRSASSHCESATKLMH